MQLLWGAPGLQWSGFIKSSARKEQWWTRDKVMDGRGSLMHMGSEDCSEWSDPTDEILKLKLWNKWMLVLIKKKVSKHTVHHTLLCMGLNSCRPARVPMLNLCPLQKAPTTGKWASELNHREKEDGGLVRIMFSFGLHGWPGVCILMHYRKNANRMQNFESCHSCGCCIDMYHLPKHLSII